MGIVRDAVALLKELEIGGTRAGLDVSSRLAKGLRRVRVEPRRVRAIKVHKVSCFITGSTADHVAATDTRTAPAGTLERCYLLWDTTVFANNKLYLLIYFPGRFSVDFI